MAMIFCGVLVAPVGTVTLDGARVTSGLSASAAAMLTLPPPLGAGWARSTCPYATSPPTTGALLQVSVTFEGGVPPAAPAPAAFAPCAINSANPAAAARNTLNDQRSRLSRHMIQPPF